MRNKTLANALLIFVAGSSYGCLVPIVKVAADRGYYAADFLPLQYLVALIVCLIYALIKRVSFTNPKECAKIALLGVCAGLTSSCYYVSVALLPSAVALTLLFQYVWVSVLFECVIERRLPTRSTVMAVAIVLVGTVFAAGVFDDTINSLNPVGVLFGAGSSVFYAVFLYLSGRIGTTESAALRAVMIPLGGLIVTTLIKPSCFAMAFTGLDMWPFAISLSVLGIILPTTLITYASPKLSTGMVSVMASSELPVGILAAWFFVADTPTPLVLLGAILVLIGIVVKQVTVDKN